MQKNAQTIIRLPMFIDKYGKTLTHSHTHTPICKTINAFLFNWNVTLLYHHVVLTISSSVTIWLSHSINLVKMTISTPKCFTLFIIILVTVAASVSSSTTTTTTQRTILPRKIRKCLVYRKLILPLCAINSHPSNLFQQKFWRLAIQKIQI